MIENNLSKAYSCLAYDGQKMYEDYLERLSEQNGLSIDDLYKAFEEENGIKVSGLADMISYYYDSTKEQLTEDYGKYTISAEVTDYVEHSVGEVLSDIDALCNDDAVLDINDYINKNYITDAYVVDVEVRIHGATKSSVQTEKVTVIKYNGSWKVFNTSNVLV